MIRYLLLAIPYVFQLLCIIHVMKNHREFYWIWIIIILPYVGGLAYLIVEIMPGLWTRRNAEAIKANVTNVLAPGKKIESLKNKAAYSPTVENRMEYADALAEQGDLESALAEYKACLEGMSKNNPVILFKTASILFRMEDYGGATELMKRLPRNAQGIYEQKAWNSLHLGILEKTASEAEASSEYDRVRSLVNDRVLDYQYLEYLDRIGDSEKLSAMIEKIRMEESSLREMNVRYDRTFYRKAYGMEKRMKKQSGLGT